MRKSVEFVRRISQSLGAVTLLHGTDLESAMDLLSGGVSADTLREISGGSETFWLLSADDMASAWTFAQVNPRGSEDYAVVRFDVPGEALRRAIDSGDVMVDAENWEGMTVYEFGPSSFGLLNASPRGIARQTQPAPAGQAVARKDEMIVSVRVAGVAPVHLQKAAGRLMGGSVSQEVVGIEITEHEVSENRLCDLRLDCRGGPDWRNHVVVVANRIRKAFPGAVVNVMPVGYPAS